jgi:hypothetical protein
MWRELLGLIGFGLGSLGKAAEVGDAGCVVLYGLEVE